MWAIAVKEHFLQGAPIWTEGWLAVGVGVQGERGGQSMLQVEYCRRPAREETDALTHRQ